MLHEMQNLFDKIKEEIELENKKNIKLNILLEYMPLLFELYESSRKLCDNYHIGFLDENMKLNHLKSYINNIENIVDKLENFKK